MHIASTTLVAKIILSWQRMRDPADYSTQLNSVASYTYFDVNELV